MLVYSVKINTPIDLVLNDQKEEICTKKLS